MGSDTDDLVARWVTRLAHQARHKLDSADVTAWQNGLRGLTPARLDLAFQDHFEIASTTTGMPSIREIKAHIARQIQPHQPEPVTRRPMATTEKRFLDTAQDFCEKIRWPLDWENLPVDAPESVVDDQLRRYADAAAEYWRQRGVTGDAANPAWTFDQNVQAWRNAVEKRRHWEREREALADAKRGKAEAKLQAQRELAERRRPVAVAALVEALPDGRVVQESFDPENPDSIPF